MRKRKTTTKSQKRKRKSSRAVRERVSVPLKYGILTVICGTFLVAGFFGAARQHFASIDYGIKNSKLKKQIKELESEKQRLILAREVAYSPAKIKKAARKIGMVDSTSRIQTTYTAVKISADEKEDDKKEVAEAEDKSKKKEDKKEKAEKPEVKRKDKKKSETKTKNLKKKRTDKKSKAKETKKLKPKVQKAKDSTTSRKRKVNVKK